jgi:uncharacterized protein (DUF1501 family)
VPLASLLPINPIVSNGSDVQPYGLHPLLGGVRDLFESGKAALVFNVGPLVAPLTQAEYLQGTVAVPYQLFSHVDQIAVWQTSVAEQPGGQTGWGGRIADVLHSLNGNSRVSMSISTDGTNMFQVGRDVFQYHVGPEGAIALNSYTPGSIVDPESRAVDRMLALQNRNIFENAYRTLVGGALDVQQVVTSALASSGTVNTPFPTSRLGRQLRIVSRLLAARQALGHQRQVFFVALGGFDTHVKQNIDLPPLLTELNDALVAFYQATVELGIANRVTTFTASDFGRALSENGDGSDHGWGSHHLIIGDAVNGRRTFGRYPILAIGGPDDVGQGRWLPTTSVEEYGATLARWFGVAASDLPLVFPNLGRFATPNLGFMA